MKKKLLTYSEFYDFAQERFADGIEEEEVIFILYLDYVNGCVSLNVFEHVLYDLHWGLLGDFMDLDENHKKLVGLDGIELVAYKMTE